MRSRRLLALLALAFVTFVAQASCVSVFGVDDEGLQNVVEEMCKCHELQQVADCEKTLGDRFARAGSAARAAWLTRYEDNNCSSCKNVLTCLSTTPTCSVGACSSAEECCQTGSAKASCESHTCQF